MEISSYSSGVALVSRNLITNQLCGAQYHSRGCKLFIRSEGSQHFMEPKGSLQSSQELSTCTYPEPNQSSPQHSILSLKGLRIGRYRSTMFGLLMRHISTWTTWLVNKMCHFGCQNRRVIHERVQHAPKSIVWVAITNHRLMSQIFFEETVSSECCLSMLHNTLVSHLATIFPINTQWFMMDGARMYTQHMFGASCMTLLTPMSSPTKFLIIPHRQRTGLRIVMI
jgi:hypothetical protein